MPRPGCEVLRNNPTHTGADMISHVKSAFTNRRHGTSLRGMNHFANGWGGLSYWG